MSGANFVDVDKSLNLEVDSNRQIREHVNNRPCVCYISDSDRRSYAAVYDEGFG